MDKTTPIPLQQRTRESALPSQTQQHRIANLVYQTRTTTKLSPQTTTTEGPSTPTPFTCSTPTHQPTLHNTKHKQKPPTSHTLLLSTLGLLALFILITLIAFITNNKSNDNTTTIDLRHTLEHDNYVHNAVFSPNSNHVITASRDGTAKI